MNKKRMFSWMNDCLEARDTSQYGKGVFATKIIKKNTLLIVFGGYVLAIKEEMELPLSIRDIGIQIERDLVIGIISNDQLSPADYINHSCDPNSGIKGQISLVAMRDIEVGEEITFDYGTVLFRDKNVLSYELKCLCGTENCRGKITSNDWKILEFQKKYKDYLPYYIKEEINKNIL